MFELNSKFEYYIKDVRVNLTFWFKLNWSEFLGNRFRNVGILSFENICHLPILQKFSFKNIFGFETYPWHQFFIKGFIFNFIASKMSSSIDQGIGVPCGCKEHNWTIFLLVKRRYDYETFHANAGLFIIENLLHQFSYLKFLSLFVIGKTALLYSQINELAQSIDTGLINCLVLNYHLDENILTSRFFW